MEELKLKDNLESLHTLDNKFEDIVIQTKEQISEITENVFSDQISIIESTKLMQELSENTIKNGADIFSTHLGITNENLPFALFFFGSSSRNLMLPNSDLDIGLVYKRNCNENIKKYLEEKIKTLPFDKIDIADWNYVDEMTEKNCKSMIEYNKSVDAKYISGNIEIRDEHERTVKKNDTEEQKIKRFITEFGIFHLYDYKNKKTDYGENLKYDYGGSRDIIFLDWFYGINSELTKDTDQPFFKNGLIALEKQKIISNIEVKELENAIELILLIKFTLLDKFRNSGDESLLYSSKKSLGQCYKQCKKVFEKLEIMNEDQLLNKYFTARMKLTDLINTLEKLMLSKDTETSELWTMAKNESADTEKIAELLKDNNWQNMVPFAIHSSSNEVLSLIVNKIKDINGYEYILRIISQNDHIKDNTIKDLLISKLPEKYKEILKNK